MMAETSALPGWQTRVLGEIAEVVGGGTPARNAPAYWGGSIPWVTPTEVTQCTAKYLSASPHSITESGLRNSSARLLPAGTVLMTSRASIGYAVIAAVEMATNQGFQSLVCRAGYDNSFIYHLIPAIRLRLEREATGTTFLEISGSRVRAFRVCLPLETEQKAIAKILDAADEAIERTDALIGKLKAIKAGLLHDLLTRGLDDNGELRDPDRHPEQFKTSVLGCIPQGWDITPLGDHLIRIDQGWSPDCGQEPAGPGEWGVLKTTAVVWDGYCESENKKLPESLNPVREYEVRTGDVLMTRGGPNSRVGVVAVVHDTQGKMMLSDKIYRLVHDHSVLPRFLGLALTSERTQRHLSTMKTGMAESQTNISQRIVRSLWVALPNKEEQERIIEIVDASTNRIYTEKAYLRKLRDIKTGLMQDLLTGRVRASTHGAKA